MLSVIFLETKHDWLFNYKTSPRLLHRQYGGDGCTVHHHQHQKRPGIKHDAHTLGLGRDGSKLNQKHAHYGLFEISLLDRLDRNHSIAIATTNIENINLVRAIHLTSQEDWSATWLLPQPQSGLIQKPA